MSHWQLLDLTPDADERSIKRAYARLLKTHRPDEDPEAFQRLREAYESSLAEARWRAQADDEVIEEPALVTIEDTAAQSTLQADVPALVMTFERVEVLDDVSPPDPSLEQIQQWLDEGKERQVLDALRIWLASDWLLPFERRQQFEQRVLDWLESAPEWSPAFFDAVCQAMHWDEAQGSIPCDYWRWDRLIYRCESRAMEETIRSELARYDADKLHGQAAALLLKPMSDHRRRSMADYFTSLDWQRFTQLAQSIEYQNPDIPRRLGLQPLENWRDWLPPSSYRSIYIFLWLALSAVLIASALLGPGKTGQLGSIIFLPVFVPVVMWIGMKAYHVWAMVAVALGKVDVIISRELIPHRWYRQGAGLLLFRHIVPCLAPAALAWVWSASTTALIPMGPMLVLLGTLYFTDEALSGGQVSLGARALAAIKRKAGRLPWHLLQRESLIAIFAVLGTAGFVYFRMKNLL
ncbi:heat-shock protein [Pseudomonas sp. S25]|uniref:Heat-shock protein n=1 Tax=Pseudomonas maioricensis TaxID=1766623 RepID=A0ABS9ZHV1_9PSED|nr:J domain-containing protein [Pseudomonas sp. S25]MCI8210012.1 heat-shock protein [Pseudomonas sp. S25]